jgi:T-complex protein 1 subunit beta
VPPAALQTLVAAAEDNAADAVAFREDLMNIARTTLSSKLVTHEKAHFAELAVDAVLRLKVRCWHLPCCFYFSVGHWA